MRGPDLFDIFDPRGRANRKGLVVLAMILLFAQACVYGGSYLAGKAPQGPASWVIHSLLIWLGITAVSKRLHDLGISAWWLLWAAISVFIWTFVASFAVVLTLGLEAATPGSTGMMIAMAISFAPVLALTVWLHAAPGVQGDNKFGPSPGALGISKPDRSNSAEQSQLKAVFAR
jgi:uncharacterized membrane protein YhaH (DUF805 family)